MMSMIGYRFHDLTLVVHQDRPETGVALGRVLHDLSWVRTRTQAHPPSLGLWLHQREAGWHVPPRAREVFQAEGFHGLECDDDFYLTDGASCFRLQMGRGRGEAWLTRSFGEKPALLQRTFWAFGLLKLFRSLGWYSLHAAGVVNRQGQGLLIVGGSGCGKSTLTLSLLRQGWSYISDDAVLLRQQPAGVEAFACRKHVYVNADAAPAYADLPLGDEVSDAAGRRKRRVRIDVAFPRQQVAGCLPRGLLFPQIVPDAQSALHPLDRCTALREILTKSGPQLFDRATMSTHLEVLRRLVQQSATYQLRAGRDLYHNPLTLVRLLSEAEGAGPWLGS